MSHHFSQFCGVRFQPKECSLNKTNACNGFRIISNPWVDPSNATWSFEGSNAQILIQVLLQMLAMDSESSQTPDSTPQMHLRGRLRGLRWFWIHCKHLFCTKNIPWAENGPHKTVKNDDSSLNHSFVGPFWAELMLFVQNKCLQWIQNHLKPLIWPLKCYLEHIYFNVFLCCIVKSMGHNSHQW